MILWSVGDLSPLKLGIDRDLIHKVDLGRIEDLIHTKIDQIKIKHYPQSYVF